MKNICKKVYVFLFVFSSSMAFALSPVSPGTPTKEGVLWKARAYSKGEPGMRTVRDNGELGRISLEIENRISVVNSNGSIVIDTNVLATGTDGSTDPRKTTNEYSAEAISDLLDSYNVCLVLHPNNFRKITLPIGEHETCFVPTTFGNLSANMYFANGFIGPVRIELPTSWKDGVSVDEFNIDIYDVQTP